MATELEYMGLLVLTTELFEALEELLAAEKLDDDDPRLQEARVVARSVLRKVERHV